MRDRATLYAIQWAGLVAQIELFGIHGPGSALIEDHDMVGSVIPSVESSLINSVISRDPTAPARGLPALRHHFTDAGAPKWGVWTAGDDERGAAAARDAGLVLDSTPAAMVAPLDGVPDAEAEPVDLRTVGEINDAAYGFGVPKLAAPLASLPDTVLPYAVRAADGAIGAVALAFDHGHEDTTVWFVATRPDAQRQGLGHQVMAALLHDARRRGNRTASLQSSSKGRGLYESLGFVAVGAVHLYEERLA